MTAKTRGGGSTHASLRTHGHWTPSLDDRTVAPSLDKRLKPSKKDGGGVDSVDIWGRRRLAYDIKKKSEGIYAVVQMTAEPATALETWTATNLNEVVMRTKLLRPGAWLGSALL